MSRSTWRKLKSAFLVTAGSVTVFSVCSIYYEKQKFYEKYLVPFTHKLDPELAHKLTILWFKTGFVPKSSYIDTPLLAQSIKHLSFRNPIGIAAGFDKNGEVVPALERIGFGFVEVGSVTPEPQPGNEKPRVFRLAEDKAVINRYGFNSDGHQVVHERLQKIKRNESLNCILGVNLGKNKYSENPTTDYVQGINIFSDVADYFVINVSSPNTPGLRDLQKEENLKSILSAVITARNNLDLNPKPLIFLKLAPDLTQQEKKDIANVLKDKKCKIDGLIISNTTVERDPVLKSSFASESGGLSGLPLKLRSTELIAEMFKLTKGSLPIIGVGGVFSGQDAYDKIKAGACLVQIYTSFTYHGPPLISTVKKELETLVREYFIFNFILLGSLMSRNTSLLTMFPYWRNQNIRYNYNVKDVSCEQFLSVFTFLVWLTFTLLTGYSIMKHYWKLRSFEEKEEKKYPDEIPGPKALPIFGTRWIYSSWFGIYNLNKVHEAYEDLFLRYGDIIKEEALWNVPVISIVDKDSIKKVLKQSGKYPFRPPNEVTAFYRKSRPDRYTNLGLVNEQGETWHLLRTILTPELTSNKTMKEFLPELMMVTDDFIRLVEISKNACDVVVNFEQLCNRLGLESTCTLVLGKRFNFLQDSQVDPLGQSLSDAISGQFCASRDTFYGLPLWKVFSTPAYKKFIKCENTIYDIISKLVENAIREDADSCPIDNVHLVFRSILGAPTLDIRDKKAAIIDFIAAGIKTLGNTLVFLLYLVAKHPHVQNKLYTEIESITKDHKSITMDSLRGATYLRSCLMEAFRLLPTAPCVARILENKTDLGDFTLPVGSIVLCHTWLACLREKNFERASEFLPERWLSDSNCKSSTLVIPFGYGRRMCPGKRFVELELQVVLAQLIQSYEIGFVGELKLEFEFLLAPAPSTNFTFRNRL